MASIISSRDQRDRFYDCIQSQNSLARTNCPYRIYFRLSLSLSRSRSRCRSIALSRSLTRSLSLLLSLSISRSLSLTRSLAPALAVDLSLSLSLALALAVALSLSLYSSPLPQLYWKCQRSKFSSHILIKYRQVDFGRAERISMVNS